MGASERGMTGRRCWFEGAQSCAGRVERVWAPTDPPPSFSPQVELPAALTGASRSDDPAVARLYERLADLSHKLMTGDLGIPPEGERSPSPPPTYDRSGVRLNTREVRTRDKISEQRQEVMEELVRADPAYRPPPDFRPSKKKVKLYIPQRQFPSFNFIGMIIGPRGATQRKLQAETGCRVVIRGKGSVKEGAARDPRHEDEADDLHVLIEGDTKAAVDAAVAVVKPMLDPHADQFHEQKDRQLRELAIINGTLKAEDACFLCGDTGHRQFECPSRAADAFQLSTAVQSKVDAQYARDVARMGGGGEGVAPDDEYRSFLAELGGGDGGGPERARPPPRSGPGGGPGGAGRDAPNECRLFIGNVGHGSTEQSVRAALEPHGDVVSLELALDAGGAPKGFAFAVMATPEGAAAACRQANGALVDGRQLRVQPRGGGAPPPGVPPGGFPLPPPQGFGGGGPGGPSPTDLRTVHVHGIGPGVTEAALEAALSEHGAVDRATVVVDPATGHPLGFASVVFADPASATRALEADGAPLAPGGPRVGVRRPPPPGGPRGPPGGWGWRPPPPAWRPPPQQQGWGPPPPQAWGPPPPGAYGAPWGAAPPPPGDPPPPLDVPPPPPPDDEPPPPPPDEPGAGGGAPPPPPPDGGAHGGGAGWGPPPPQAGWGAPQPHPGWGAPPPQQGWGAPPYRHHGAPPPYGAVPPPGPGYGAVPPSGPAYGAVPPPALHAYNAVPPPPPAGPPPPAPPPPPPPAASGPRLEPRGAAPAPGAAPAGGSVVSEYERFLSELGS